VFGLGKFTIKKKHGASELTTKELEKKLEGKTKTGYLGRKGSRHLCDNAK